MVATTMNHSTPVAGPVGQIEGFLHRTISAAFAGLRRRAKYNQIVRELSEYSDRGLNDIGIARHDILRIAREGARED